MSHYLPVSAFAHQTPGPHPALSLPSANEAVGAGVDCFKAKLMAREQFKADIPSLADFIRRAYQRGWLSTADLNSLPQHREKMLALFPLAEKGASFVSNRLELGDAIKPLHIEKRLGGEPLDAQSIRALAHAGMEAGVIDNEALLKALQTQSNLVGQFPGWLIEQLDAYVTSRAASALSLPTESVDKPFVEFNLEGHECGSVLMLRNPDMISLFGLYLPLGDDSDSIMLRDTLCLLSEVLDALNLNHQDPFLLFSGGYMGQDEVQTVRKHLAGADATEASVADFLCQLIIEGYVESGGSMDDVAGIENDIEALMQLDDVGDALMDELPSLVNGAESGVLLSIGEWIENMVEMLAEGHWSQRKFIPDDMRLGHGISPAAEQQTNKERIAAYFKEHVQALAEQLGDRIPETVQELTRIATWLEKRAEKGVLEIYLEDNDYAEGLHFEMTYVLAANATHERSDGVVPLSLGEQQALAFSESEVMDIGDAPRAALVALGEGFETTHKLLEIAVSYQTLGTALQRLSIARKKEQRR